MASMASNSSRQQVDQRRAAADRVATKHLGKVKEQHRTWRDKAKDDHIKQAAKEAVEGGRIRSREDYRAARDYYRANRQEAEAQSVYVPQEYTEKYGSQGYDMYRKDQLDRQVQDKLTETRNAGVPAAYVEKYGSQAGSMYQADELNRIQQSNAREILTPGQDKDRVQAMQEAMSMARSAGNSNRFYQAAQKGEGALRDAYRQEYAQWGNSPNVIGMKDVQELENRGYSGGDIRRIGLAVGSVGPKAKERIRMLTGQPL